MFRRSSDSENFRDYSSHFFNSITRITNKIIGVYLFMVFEICLFVLKKKGNKEHTKITFGPRFFFCSEKYGERKNYLIQRTRTIFRITKIVLFVFSKSVLKNIF